jgi:hypothetical protein
MSAERTASLRVAGAAGGQMIVKPRQTVGIEPAPPIRADGIAETGPEPGLSGGEQWVAQHRGNDPGTPHLANGGRLRARPALDLLLFRRREGA